MTPPEWVTIFSCVGAVIASLVGGTWILSAFLGKMKDDFATKLEALRAESDRKLLDKVRERNEKIEGIGQSLDRHKKECKEDFVLKEVCHQMHAQTKDDVSRIERDNKESRHEFNDKVGKIFLLIDVINASINELKLQSVKK